MLTCCHQRRVQRALPARISSACRMRGRTRGRGAEGAADVQGHQRHALPARADARQRRHLVREAHAVHQREHADVAGRELQADELRDHIVERVRGRDDPRQLLRGRPARAGSARAAASRGRAARGLAQHEPHRPAGCDGSQMCAACCMQGERPPKRPACSTGALARAPATSPATSVMQGAHALRRSRIGVLRHDDGHVDKVHAADRRRRHFQHLSAARDHRVRLMSHGQVMGAPTCKSGRGVTQGSQHERPPR